MKVLITWHAAVEPAYRKLYTELSLKGVKLLAVAPTYWTEGCRLQSFKEKAQDSCYEWTIFNTVFTDRIRAFVYPNVFSLCWRVSRFNPDIFHIIEEPFSLSAAQFALIRDMFCPEAKIILNSFENIDIYQGFPFHYAQNFNLKRADALIIAPKEGRNIWEDRGFSRKIYHVPLGVDTKVFHPLDESELSPSNPFPTPNNDIFNVGYIGRLTEEKGVNILVEAIHLLKNNRNRIALFLVGSGSLRKELEKRVCMLGLSQDVKFINPLEQHELPVFLHHMDALVLPSITTTRWKEQFGRVLVEAMACKVPVVGSSSGEIPNVVGDAGLIFEEGNAKALSESLDMLMRDETQREQMVLKGLNRVKEMYTWSAVAERLIEIYKEILR